MADYSLRHRRDGNAGTTILYHLRNYRSLHSSSVITAVRRELLEDGHRRRIRRGRRTFHATFGSGPMRQSDERDSEPDYLQRPTRHGPGMVYNSGKGSFYLTINE